MCPKTSTKAEQKNELHKLGASDKIKKRSDRMSNSKLVNYVRFSPNCTKPRNNSIKKITIHMVAGNCSVETLGEIFAPKSRQASSNYGIGSDGRVGLYVEEANRSWCSGSRENDHQAITIEVANDSGAPEWHVSDKAMKKLIALCVDICKRNGIEKLNFTGDKNGNLTMHKYFQDTSCPGQYLESKFPYIADEVNKALGVADKPQPAEKESTKTVNIELLVLRKGENRGNEQIKTLQRLLKQLGYYKGSVDGSFGGGTQNAIEEFQAQRGIGVDGVVGKATWTELLKG